MLAGEFDRFDVFAGPINDNTGAERVAAGAQLTQADLIGMNWLVEGIQGSIPTS
jgi:basic membrane protein A and related proteins